MHTDQLATNQKPPTIHHLQIEQPPPQEQTCPSRPLRKIVAVASIAAGIQFGWALQLSLLTPYVQLLGIPHAWASFIWLCGPISGLLVQPIVGHFSDRCTSRFGRRRPFIAAGTASVTFAVFLIGFAADLGHLFGDSVYSKVKTRAVVVFVVGFWILDVANNMLQGPCRALLADLSGDDQKKMRSGNAFFALFVAIGNVLGYAAGSYRHLYKMFPFTKTKACDLYCANLKSCFFISIFLLLSLTILALSYVREKAWSPDQQPKNNNNNNNNDEEPITPCFGEIVAALRNLDKPMWVLMLVMALNSLAWFPFLLYDTDWMGREVYGGDSNGNNAEVKLYDKGVRAGALGLMLNSVLMGFASLGTMGRSARSMKRLWGGTNFLLAVCLAMTVLITKLAENHRAGSGGAAVGLSPPPPGIKASALVLFTVMGIPLAITYSIPFALASMFSNNSGAGQGLSLGVLNLSVVIPQMIVSLVGGPWDALFGGGNLPAFVVGAIAAAVSGIFALTMLPSPSPFLSSSKSLAV